MKALLVGMATGVLFQILGLPIPAPGVLDGILGIFGIFFGALLVVYFKQVG